MGVDTTNYIVFGYKLPYNAQGETDDEREDFYDKYEDLFDSHYDEDWKKKDVSIIADAMGSHYCVIGRIIDRTDSDCYCFSKDFNIIPSTIITDELVKQIKEKFIELFPKYKEYTENPPQYMVFSHCS